MIRSATPDDAAQHAAIYNYYIEHTIVTFEEIPITDADMRDRIDDCIKSHPWLVAERDGEILGYAYAMPWASRMGYRTSAETTVYIAHQHTGQGLGFSLYSDLIEKLREQGLHCAVGGIALPNPGSIALHEKLGFKKAAEYREIGTKFGQWIDVGYWQLIL